MSGEAVVGSCFVYTLAVTGEMSRLVSTCAQCGRRSMHNRAHNAAQLQHVSHMQKDKEALTDYTRAVHLNKLWRLGRRHRPHTTQTNSRTTQTPQTGLSGQWSRNTDKKLGLQLNRTCCTQQALSKLAQSASCTLKERLTTSWQCSQAAHSRL